MPRKARVILSNTPHHIVQRGHNRKAVFIEQGDYRYHLDNLLEWKEKLDCKVYAYCLMTNHVHLIIDPGETPDNLSRLMKRLAGRQTRLVNAVEARTGSLWEGRFKCSPIETHRYLLACCRYVERNPVRARMATMPEEYKWSSYRGKVGREENAVVDWDVCYQSLGHDDTARQMAYARWVNCGDDKEEVALIRSALSRCQLTGTARFAEEVEERMGFRIQMRGPGRPRKREFTGGYCE